MHCDGGTGEVTRVHGILRPRGHETLEPGDEDEQQGRWYRHHEPTVLFYIGELQPAVVARIEAMTRHGKAGASGAAQ